MPPKRKTAKVPKTVKDYVNHRLNVQGELKQASHKLGSTAISYTGEVFPVSLLAAGVLDFNRDGDVVEGDSLEFRGEVYMDTVDEKEVELDYVARVIVVMDHKCTGEAPALEDLIQWPGSTDNPCPHLSPYKPDYTERFKVLSDTSYHLWNFSNGGTTAIAGKGFALFHKKINLKKVKMHYKAGSVTADLTDAAKNNIFIMVLSNHNTASLSTNIYTCFKFRDA